jgi:hypothetical protein
MKSVLATSLLALGALSGCKTWGPERIDTTGGHPVLGATQPMTPAALDAEVDTGRLLVKAGDAGGRAVAYPGYEVYDPSGLKVAHQAVQTGNGTEGAAELKLAPGRYFVRLDEPGQGPREFWVTVERAKVTRIDNNRNGTPPTVR